MNSLNLLLDQLDNVLSKYNPVNYERLQNPLSKNEVSRYMRELGITDKDFELLSRWKNGCDLTGSVYRRLQLFDFGTLLPLESILKLKTDSTDSWEKTFIPLVSSGEGTFILFNNKKGKDYGKLHLYSVALLFIDEPISYYDSIQSMLQTTIEAYEKEILVFSDNYLDNDVIKFHKLGKKYNKKSDYWKLK